MAGSTNSRTSTVLVSLGCSIAAVYLLDSQFVTDGAKFIAGCMAALAAMMQLELPHVNVLSKMDLLKEKRSTVERCVALWRNDSLCTDSPVSPSFLQPDMDVFARELSASMAPRYRRLNEAVASLIDDYSMVSFVPLDVTKEDSIADLLQVIDSAIQYGEDADVRTSGTAAEADET